MNQFQPRLKPKLAIAAVILIVALAISGCINSRFDATLSMAATNYSVPGGDAQHGSQLIAQYGCGTCHVIAGVHGANGLVGPPLTGIADRAIIAGMLRNTPDGMVMWIMHPQQVVPGNAMPDLGISDGDAHDIAAYLYTLHQR